MAYRAFTSYVNDDTFKGPNGVGIWEGVTFTESVVGTHTGTVVIPANSLLLEIVVFSTVLWDAGTAAAMVVGDDDDADGYFASFSVKATDLLVGEVLRMSNSEYWGGKQGAYLVAASGTASAIWYSTANNIIGVITTTGTAGSAGRTRMLVNYLTLDQWVASTNAAA